MWPLLLLAACPTTDDSGVADVAAPSPWEDLETELDPFRRLLTVPVGADAERLLAVGGAPSLAVWPGPRGGAALLDARYRLDTAARCLDPAPFPRTDDGHSRQGGCRDGDVELDRTALGAGRDVLAVVDRPEAGEVAVLFAGGEVRVASTDLLVGNPLDWLRLGEPLTLQLADGSAPFTLGALPDGGWVAAAGNAVAMFTAAGVHVEETTMPGPVRAVVVSGGLLWVDTESGVVGPHGGVLSCGEGAVLVGDGAGGVWMACPEAGSLRHAGGDGVVTETVVVAELLGPVALHPVTGVVYAAVDSGVAEIVGGEARARRELGGGPADLVVNAVGELSVLVDGNVQVYVDETALVGPPPLSAWVAGFVENPRAVASRQPCSGEEEGMEERAARALGNRPLFDDLPASLALAVSPAVALHAQRCKVATDFAEAIAGERIEAGALFHAAPDCGDQDCLDAALVEEVAALEALDVTPSFASGAAGWQIEGDWVRAVERAGIDRHAFVGLSALLEVGIDDPRGKDAAPWSGASASRPWRTASADIRLDDDPAGSFLLVPGSTLAVFNLGDCAGALQAECRMLGIGGGSVIEAEDLAVADLLLHRAAAQRGHSGESTWYFHLPAIEEYSYVEDCTRSDTGLWSGAGCEAALLQTWLFDVHARLVRAGIVRWGVPSEAARRD